MTRLLIIALVAFLSTPATAAEQDDVLYRALVQRVKSGDFTVDFRELRMVCMRSDLCQPRGSREKLAQMNAAVAAQQYEKVAQIAENLVDEGLVNAEAHATLVGAYQKLQQPAKAKFHYDITAALLRSITQTRDGKTEATAFEVICSREEYYVLSSMQLPFNGTGVTVNAIVHGAHHYSRWQILDPKTQGVKVTYFNEDAFTAKSNPR